METLYDIVITKIEAHFNNFAVICDNGRNVRTTTYREVFDQSEIVSKCLQEISVEVGFIGIFMEQNLSIPSLVLGILHRELAFTCIDPHMPQEHNLNLLQRLNISWVLTRKDGSQAEVIATFLSKYGVVVKEMNVHNEIFQAWQLKMSKLCSMTGSEQYVFNNEKMAYAIQTSGTTGVPKIVKVTHKCIIPNIQHLSSILKVGATDVVFFGTPLTFDPSVIELFLALVSGAALLIVPLSIKASPSLLLDALFPCHSQTHPGVTLLQTTPSVMSQWSLHNLQTTVLGPDTTLRVLLLGGEPCPSETILRRWRGVENKTQMFNLYGITEVSCWASIYHIKHEMIKSSIGNFEDKGTILTWQDIPLGTALMKTLLEIRDESGSKVVHGEGEMYIGSMERICIINDETKEKLTPPMFRATGDIVKIDSYSGHIFYMGRKDSLIKRYGQRVSLTQVEKKVATFPSVDKCCCIWNQAKTLLGLAIILKLDCSASVVSETLRETMVKYLPKAAFPDTVAVVDEMPLTTHGKVDRNKLSSILFDTGKLKVFSPSSSPVTVLTAIWSQFLGVNPRSGDTFLQSGGHSILALQLTKEVEKALGKTVPNNFIPMLLTGSSFSECCDCLRSQCIENDSHSSNKLNISTSIQEKVSDLATSSIPQTVTSTLNNTDKISYKTKGTTCKEKQYVERIEAARKCKKKWKSARTRSDCKKRNPEISTHLYYAGDTVNLKNVCNVKYKYLEDVEGVVVKQESNAIYKRKSTKKRLNVQDMGSNTSQAVESVMSETEDGRGNLEPYLYTVRCRGQIVVYSPATGLSRCCECRNINLKVGWKFDLGKCVDASPCYLEYSSGKAQVVVGSHSRRLVVLDGSTGNVVTECMLPDRIESSVCPSLCGKYGVVGCYDGKVYNIDLSSGTVHWCFSTGSMVKSSPVLCLGGSAIVVGSYDYNLYCIRIQNGSLVWCTTPGNGSVFASPCISPKGIIYIAALDGTCAAICEHSGTLKWNTKLGSPVFSSPVLVRASAAVVFAEVQGIVHCFSTNNGSKLWTHKAGGNIFSSVCTQPFSSVEPYELIIFGCHDKNVYCLRWPQEKDITLQWKLELDSAIFATPFMFPTKSVPKLKQHECDYLLDTRDADIDVWAAIATTKGTILVIDAETSTIQCSHSLPHEVFSSPIVCDERLIVGCRDNFVYSLNLAT